MVQTLSLMKRETDRLGLEYRVFPVDEPDGKPDRRAWVRFAATMAHRAGLKVWNTHNDPRGWTSGIDESCMGGRINAAYALVNGQAGTLAWPDDEESRWIREHIHWNYEQIRSRSMPWTRYILGVQSWYYRTLDNVTAFVYDQNTRNLYMVYPDNGDMFWNRPHTPYYGTYEQMREKVVNAILAHSR